MGKLVYFAIASLDGFIEDAEGGFAWTAPDEEVHRFINALVRPVGTYLYGRRMYETMAVWETEPEFAAGSDITGEFAKIWQAADKIVYSRTLKAAPTARTRIERQFVPDEVLQVKASSGADVMIGGPELASQAFRAGLIDEVRLFLAPAVVGGGKRAFPAGHFLELALLDQRRFGSGMIQLHYRTMGR